MDREFCVPTSRETMIYSARERKEQRTVNEGDPTILAAQDLDKAPSCDWPSGELIRGTNCYTEYRHMGGK